MKKVIGVALLLTYGILGRFSIASAGMYFPGVLGFVWLNDADIDEGHDSGELSFDNGAAFTGSFCYDFSNGLRTEVELGARVNDIDEVSVSGYGSGSVDGDVTTVSTILNAFYDFMLNNKVSSLFGLGIGYANVEIDIDGAGNEDDNVLAYQGSAGVSYAFNERFKCDVQYRYFATEDLYFNGLDSEYKTHNLMVGLRFGF